MFAMEASYVVFYAIPYLLLIIAIGSLFQTAFYNLYRHPLAHIPGPKLAAASYHYQTYFGLVGGSRFYKEIARLHKEYGKLLSKGPVCKRKDR